MSPEAKLLPDPPDPESFKSDPCYQEPYDSAAELDIYGGEAPSTAPSRPSSWAPPLRLWGL